MATETPEEQAGAESPVLVHARRGCPFCTALRAGLRRRGMPFRELDIWADDDARRAVRAAADGNETVPTVRVGDRWMVNPSVDQVLQAVAEVAPESLPRESPGPVSGLLNALGLRHKGS